MSIKTVRWVLASLLFLVATLVGLSACSDDKPVVIQPGIFSEDWPTALRGKLIKNKNCWIDSVNGKSTGGNNYSLTLKSGEALQLSGWIFSQDEGTPPEIYVQLVGPALTYTAVTPTRLARPDVNQFLKLAAAWNPGFELNASQHAEPNAYVLYILQVESAGVAECKTNASINIQ